LTSNFDILWKKPHITKIFPPHLQVKLQGAEKRRSCTKAQNYIARQEQPAMFLYGNEDK
jgi:hypothetical protein